MTFPGEPPNPWSREGQGTAPGQYQYQAPPPYYPPPPPRTRRKVTLWVGFGVLMAMVVGAAIWGAIAETRSENSSGSASPAVGSPGSTVTSGQTVVVTATDKKSQLTVPVSWKDVPKSFKSDMAVIQLGDLRREQYMVVLTLDRSDFEDFTTFTGAMVDGAKSAIEGAEVGPPRGLTIDGLSAMQYQITGKANGIKIVFWYTMVDGKNGYYQLVGWTLPSKKAEAEPVITEVTSSFRELAAA